MILANNNIFFLICNGHQLTTVITRLFRGRRRSSRKSLGLEDEVDLKVPPFGELSDLSMITYINFMLVLTEMDNDGSKVILENNIFCMQPKSGALAATVCRITSRCDHNKETLY